MSAIISSMAAVLSVLDKRSWILSAVRASDSFMGPSLVCVPDAVLPGSVQAHCTATVADRAQDFPPLVPGNAGSLPAFRGTRRNHIVCVRECQVMLGSRANLQLLRQSVAGDGVADARS